MKGIIILIFLVHCSNGVFNCETIPIDNTQFTSMETCKSKLRHVLATKSKISSQDEKWMGKCVYRINKVDLRETLLF